MSDDRKTIVHLDNVTKRFGKTVAVDRLDMKIMAGEFVTFLGPSGCGKSTTLRILGGFETPDEGRVILDGTDVTRLPPNSRDVNMVFQDYALFPHMSVARNIAFGLESRGQTHSEIDAQVNRLLEFLQLEGYGGRMPDQLSGGQRQRVALARALAPDPKLLLLDEPLGALDAKLRTQVQVELKDIQKRTGKTFFFVTHDQEEALTMSDRIVVMNEGQVEQDGTPQELYYHPRSRFVAEFIGETNLIEGTARGASDEAAADGAIVIDWHGMEVRGVAPFGSKPAAGEAVTAALRPENIVCHREKPAEGQAVAGRLLSRVFKGSRTSAEIGVDGHDDIVLRAYMDPKQAEALPESGLWISWKADHLAVLQE